MRLTLTLLKQIAPGNINTGRNKIWPKVTGADLKKARKQIERTERNMLLLRHPYLSLEESYGHEESLCSKEDLEFLEKLEERQKKREKREIRDTNLQDALMKLRKSDKWD